MDVCDVFPSTFACVHSRGHLLRQSSRKFVRMLISIKSMSRLKMDYFGSKTRSLNKILEKKSCVYTVEETVLILGSINICRMLGNLPVAFGLLGILVKNKALNVNVYKI